MQNILKNTTAGDRAGTPWILLLILSGYVVAALFLFTLLAQLLILPFFDFDIQNVISALSNPYASEATRLPLMILQGITSLGAFILVPLLFIRKNLELKFEPFFKLPEHVYQPIFMTAVIMFCFMVANSVIIEWNQKIDLPEPFSVFEEWAQTKELQLEKLTKYLTSFTGFHELLIALLVIAVIPAIGEELLFRGLVQNLFHSALKNPHIAIWLSALLFGAFHLQFYGVVPRMLLGALFGYLYYWSGHLSLAMIGHFINNGFTLIMLYLSQQKIIDFDPVSTEASPPYYVILIFFIIGSVLLVLFKNFFDVKQNA